MSLEEAVRRRRMVRSFSGRPLDPAVVDRLVDLAIRSPTAGNTGGWAPVVLAGPSETWTFWHATTSASWRARSRRWPGLSRAPVIVVLLTRPAAYAERYRQADKASSGLGALERWPVPYWFVDVGMAAMTLLLGARASGIGACFLGNFRGEAALLEALGVPPEEGWRYAGAVVLGEPGDDDPPSSSLARGRGVQVHRGRW